MQKQNSIKILRRQRLKTTVKMAPLFTSAIAWETNQLLREDNKIITTPSVYKGSDYIYRAFHNVLRDYKHL
jgi:hypothetical protein